jgi:hypothetical protein
MVSDALIDRLLRGFDGNKGATPAQVDAAGQALGVELPADYKSLLQRVDGGEGPVGDESYLVLWPAARLAECNDAYRLDPEYGAGLIFIGTDGGNELFAIRESDGHYVQAPMIGMGPDAVMELGRNVTEFLMGLD